VEQVGEVAGELLLVARFVLQPEAVVEAFPELEAFGEGEGFGVGEVGAEGGEGAGAGCAVCWSGQYRWRGWFGGGLDVLEDASCFVKGFDGCAPDVAAILGVGCDLRLGVVWSS